MLNAKLKPVSNQGDWSTAMQFIDRASGDPVDLGGDSFRLVLRPLAAGGRRRPALAGSTVTGELSLPSLGILAVYFPASAMRALEPGTYEVGLSISNGVLTAQVIVGRLPIIDGVVGDPTSATLDH